MTNGEYRAIVFSRTLYQELELKPECGSVRIGTTRECDVRLNAEQFYESIMLAFVCENGQWHAECSDNLYIAQDTILKKQMLVLNNGVRFTLCYAASEGEIFQVEIIYNFDQITDFDCYFPYPQRGVLTIGGGSCDLCIHDDIVGNSYIVISRNGSRYTIDGSNSALGVYLNGTRHMGTVTALDYDFVMLGGYTFFLKEGYVYTHRSSHVDYRDIRLMDIQPRKHEYRYPKFNRTTRVTYKVPEEKLEVLDPEKPAEPKEENLLMTIMPALGSLALTVVLRGVVGGGGTFVIYSACTIIMGTAVSVVNYRRDRKKRKEQEEKRRIGYEQYIADKNAYIQQSRQAELRALNRIHLSVQEDISMVDNFMPTLFEKDSQSEDFLTIRYGSGVVESCNPIGYKPQEFASPDPLAYYPQQLAQNYRYLTGAPVVTDLKEKGSVGIVGSQAAQDSFLRAILLDLVIRHSFQEVKLIYIGQEKSEILSWLRWLKNNMDEKSGRRMNIVNEDSKNAILDFIYTELTQREKPYPCYVVVVQELSVIENHPILGLIDESGAKGFYFFFAASDREMLPYGLSELVILHGDNRGDIIDAADGDRHQGFDYEAVSNQTACRVARKLASVEMEEISLESALTKNISLYRLLDIKNAEDLNLDERWSRSQVFRSMAAPMGVRAGGDIVYLDLNEKAHGPHGLVAGTTGSGKSEILQTYILSIATLFHPYEAAFVIIDFKGGGMVNQFKKLPHLVGAITNIDGREIDRSLLSIRAELRKRQECFARENVNHIDNYIRKYKAGECSTPLPHLILIVDEFAELKNDQPEFMKELISTARIGRSLGVHLILATQKPSGVVNDQIWSNSRFKLCLKVQDKEDSNEVLKSPLAAEIREPGRAYLQVGNNEIFELFQSAYSGASVRSEEADQMKEFCIETVDYAGKRTSVYEQKIKKDKEKTETQLDAIVSYVNQYCKKQGISPLPSICMPPLTELAVYKGSRTECSKGSEAAVPIGIYDDPEHQAQEEARMELASDNLFILGSPQYGKTNMLQLIIRSMAEQLSPREVNFYILDFSSMILKSFENMAHVSSVILASEDEKMKTFIKLMAQELKMRKEIMMSLGISSYSSYREAGFDEIPQIMVIIDNFTALKELYNGYEEDMIKLLREGVSVGITLAVTNGQMAGLGYRYMPNFSRKIALYCNDSSEYGSLFERCRLIPGNVIGRGLVEVGRSVYEFQSYLSFPGDKEIDRVNEMRRFVENINQKYAGMCAKRMPVIPNIVTKEFMAETFGKAEMNVFRIPVGIDYDTMECIFIDFSKNPVLAISGREKSGKSNLVRLMINHIQQIQPGRKSLYLLDDGKRQLKEYAQWDITAGYAVDSGAVLEWVEQLYQELTKRYEEFAICGEEALESYPFLCYVIQSQDALSALGSNSTAVKLYKELVTRYHAMKFAIIYADIENAPITYSNAEPLKMLKESRNIIYMDELSSLKLLEVNLQQAKAFKREIEQGDAFVFTANDVRKAKMILQSP